MHGNCHHILGSFDPHNLWALILLSSAEVEGGG
jgi:hypothetical protein